MTVALKIKDFPFDPDTDPDPDPDLATFQLEIEIEIDYPTSEKKLLAIALPGRPQGVHRGCTGSFSLTKARHITEKSAWLYWDFLSLGKNRASYASILLLSTL